MGKRILIVDDEKDWVKMLAIRLGHEGYQIEGAFDTVQATAQAIKLIPDLILLDIMMPGGGGLQALKNIRAHLKTFTIPAIVLTARGDKETKEAAEGMGISGYFIKTESTVDLVAKIKEVLGE